MYTEARKIHLIEEVLKVNDDDTLTKLETVFKNTKKKARKKIGIDDFIGVLSEKEAAQMKKAIEETSEIIHKDDWR